MRTSLVTIWAVRMRGHEPLYSYWGSADPRAFRGWKLRHGTCQPATVYRRFHTRAGDGLGMLVASVPARWTRRVEAMIEEEESRT